MIERRNFLKSIAFVGVVPSDKLLKLFGADETKPEKLELIFSNVDSTDQDLGMKLLPPGRYTAVCDYVTLMPSKVGRDDILIVRWKVLDHTEPAVVAQSFSTNPRTLFRLKELVQKLGVKQEWGFDTNDLIGKQAIIDIEYQTRDSYRYNKVRVLNACKS